MSTPEPGLDPLSVIAVALNRYSQAVDALKDATKWAAKLDGKDTDQLLSDIMDNIDSYPCSDFGTSWHLPVIERATHLTERAQALLIAEEEQSDGLHSRITTALEGIVDALMGSKKWATMLGGLGITINLDNIVDALTDEEDRP
jgi:hypothetical protein